MLNFDSIRKMPSVLSCQWYCISAPIFKLNITYWNCCHVWKDSSLMKISIRHALMKVCSCISAEFRSPHSYTIHRSTNENLQFLFGSVEDENFHGKDEEPLVSHSEKKSMPPWGDVSVEEHQDYAASDHEQDSEIEGLGSVHELKVHFLEIKDEELLSNRVLELSRTNKIRSALELFRSMELLGLFPNVEACNSLMASLLRNRQFDDCLKLFDIMRSKKIITAHTYSMILKAVNISQGYDAACKLFTELKSDKKGGFDAIVYNTMLSILGKRNNWVESESIWMNMKANGCVGTQVTYCLLVSSFVRCEQFELAIDAYHEMRQNGLLPGDDTMQAIIAVCTKEGKWNFALGVFQEMLKRGLKPNLVTCNALINCLGKSGKLNQAFEVFDIMKSLGGLPDAYTFNALLNTLYNAGSHGDVLHLFDIIKVNHASLMNLHLYNKALLSCSKLGSWDRAVQLLWQMEASGMSVPTQSYNLAIQACEVARKPEVAIQVYEHMVHKKCYPDTFTRLYLLRTCICGSLWDNVRDILNDAPEASLYNAAIQGLCYFGKINFASELCEEMKERGLQPDGKTQALIQTKGRRNRRRR